MSGGWEKRPSNLLIHREAVAVEMYLRAPSSIPLCMEGRKGTGKETTGSIHHKKVSYALLAGIGNSKLA